MATWHGSTARHDSTVRLGMTVRHSTVNIDASPSCFSLFRIGAKNKLHGFLPRFSLSFSTTVTLTLTCTFTVTDSSPPNAAEILQALDAARGRNVDLRRAIQKGTVSSVPFTQTSYFIGSADGKLGYGRFTYSIFSDLRNAERHARYLRYANGISLDRLQKSKLFSWYTRAAYYHTYCMKVSPILVVHARHIIGPIVV